MAKKTMRKVTFELEEEIYQSFSHYADKENRTVSGQLRELVKKYVDRQKKLEARWPTTSGPLKLKIDLLDEQLDEKISKKIEEKIREKV